MTSTEFQETLPQKLLKYCGRSGMAAIITDVVQSFFTGETYLHYFQGVSHSDAYCSDAVFFGSCILAELHYRKSVKDSIEREEKFRKSMEALDKMRQSPIEDLVEDEEF